MAPKSGKGKSNKAKTEKKKKEDKGFTLFCSINSKQFNFILPFFLHNPFCFSTVFFFFSAVVAPSLVDITVVTPYDSHLVLKVTYINCTVHFFSHFPKIVVLNLITKDKFKCGLIINITNHEIFFSSQRVSLLIRYLM